jgi:hypothetical protein
VFTRTGVERVAEYAVALAKARKAHLVSATKSNGIIHTMPFWDQVVEEVVAKDSGVRLEKVLIDALAARLVLKPHSVDVIVASNLFGDILSDLAGRRSRLHRRRPQRQPEPSGPLPLDVRAGARLCTGHRGAGCREPGRPDVGSGNDA